jgi:hypothetical protein
MEYSPTESEVAYHDPRCSRTDRDPGRVSSESSSWVMFVEFDRKSEDRAREALTYAWRKIAVSRSWRMNCLAVK